MLQMSFSSGSLENASLMPLGGSGSFKYASVCPISRSLDTLSAPMPIATRSGVPNRFANTG